MNHSKTNSWLNETISVVEAEADVMQPGYERKTMLPPKKQQTTVVSFPSPFGRNQSATLQAHTTNGVLGCGGVGSERATREDRSSFVYL